jgi:hypothetical protein
VAVAACVLAAAAACGTLPSPPRSVGGADVSETSRVDVDEVGEAMSIDDVLRENEERLMATDGVVGVGITESGGAPALSVMVKELTPKVRSDIPRELRGYPVKVEVVGEVRALSGQPPAP